MAADTGPPGAQRERTALAWERTGIGFVLVGLLFVRAAHRAVWQAPGLVVVLFGIVVLLGLRSVRVVGLAVLGLSVLAAAMIATGT